MSANRLGASVAVPLLLCAAAMPAAAQAGTDACTVLTPAQVGAAIGVPVAAGTHVTPSFVRTCTWNASGSSKVAFVTLYLQTTAAYDGGKRMANQMAAMEKKAAMELSLAKEALAKL
ncbi:MAG: hypothetical protein ACREU5_09575 [Burkholderiales bacterium]